jgi:hypothetical protein
MTERSLIDLIRKLAIERENLAEAKRYEAKRADELAVATEYIALALAQGYTKGRTTAVAEAEKQVREMALEIGVDGLEGEDLGVKLRKYNVPTYDPPAVVKWAAHRAEEEPSHLKYLTLNTKAFGDAARILFDLGAPGHMAVEYKAAIGTDLNRFLAKE